MLGIESPSCSLEVKAKVNAIINDLNTLGPVVKTEFFGNNVQIHFYTNKVSGHKYKKSYALASRRQGQKLSSCGLGNYQAMYNAALALRKKRQSVSLSTGAPTSLFANTETTRKVLAKSAVGAPLEVEDFLIRDNKISSSEANKLIRDIKATFTVDKEGEIIQGGTQTSFQGTEEDNTLLFVGAAVLFSVVGAVYVILK